MAPEAAQPVTPGQERHWFLHQYEADPSSQSHTCVASLNSDLPDGEVAATLRGAVSAHPELSRRFVMTDAGLRACPPRSGIDPVRLVDLGECSDSMLEQAVREAQRKPLDLDAGDTCIVHLFVGRGRRILCIILHACVADQQSCRLLLDEIGAQLTNPPPDPLPDPVAEPFRRNLQESDGIAPSAETSPQADEVYWIEQIGNDLPTLELPERGPRPLRKGYDAARCMSAVPEDVALRVRETAEARGCATSDVYLAAFAAVLHRWSAQETLMIGRHVDQRSRTGSRALGRLENVVPLRIDCAGDMTFRDLLDTLEARLRRDAEHEGLPFETLLKRLPGTRDLSRHPLFQAAFRYRTYTSEAADDGAVVSELVDLERAMTPYDVELRVEEGDRTNLVLLFDEAIFDHRILSRLPRHCIRVLETCTADPTVTLSAVPLLNADERAEQLERFNAPCTALPQGTVTDLFGAAARRHPDVTAVVFGENSLSYRALDARSDEMAHALRTHGAGTDTCIGVCLDRSLEMVVTVLAVLKAGAAYVPMDPAYPEDRLRIMVEDARTALVVAEARHASRLPGGVRVLSFEEIQPLNREGQAVPLARQAGPESLAYVIFTSGSTGRPKGVAMPHRALVNLIEWQLARDSFQPGARVLQYSSLSFDVSFQEIFTTWISGGTLYLIEDEHRRDPRRLLSALAAHDIQRLFLPYVALRQLIEVAHASERPPRALREVITAGEQLRVDDALRSFFARLPNASLDNQYGPSETHVITAELLRGSSAVWPALPPIGRPIRNNQAYVLDEQRRLVPVGVAGELYLAGINLAHGYIGREDLTRERFVDNPFGASGERMYRTGDLARYRPDGVIEFLGRADHQVKIRGYRIEPGEIDSVLADFPAVQQSLTRAYDDPKLGRRLVSYVLVADPEAFDPAQSRELVKSRLPEYMVPDTVIPLRELPFTPSGKVDVRALPVPDLAGRPRQVAYVPPVTPVEQSLAELWKDMLGLGEVGIHESFFDVGGDSLKAVDLFLEIDRRFGRDLPLSLLAEGSSIAFLARSIEGASPDSGSEGFQSLRVIQRGDSAVNPLFLVHGGGGNVVLFRELARRLPRDFALYAFQWDGWNGGRGRTSIEAMADLYLEEMRRLRPQGPYRLGGHCVGGMVALEMAHRLIREGESLEGPLLLTDTPNLYAGSYRRAEPEPGSPEAAAFHSVQQRLLEALAGGGQDAGDADAYRPRHGRAYKRLVRVLRILNDRVRRSEFPRFAVETFLDRSFVRLLLLGGRRIPIDYRQVYSGLSMIRAVRAYRPEPYNGDVLLFRSRLLLARTLGLRGWWDDVYLGCDELVGGELTTHFVDTTHDGLMRHPLTAEIVGSVFPR